MKGNRWVLLLFGCSAAVAEDVMSRSSTIIDASSTVDDTYIVGLFCALFALFMSFVAVLVGQYSWLEDGLMKEYLEKGVVHEASVLSAEFSRAATTEPPHGCGSNPDAHAQSEYLARVEYRVSQKEQRKILVRKQVKAFASDFRRANETSCDVPRAIDIEFAPSSLFPNTSSSDEGDTIVCCAQEIEVLVMPHYPRSGLPRSQVLRMCSFSYRMPTVALLMFLVLSAHLCLYIGVSLSPVAAVPHSLTRHEFTLLLLAAGLLMEVVFVLSCWGEGMHTGVRNIYLEGGEYVRVSRDDTTISSGDDSYLRM